MVFAQIHSVGIDRPDLPGFPAEAEAVRWYEERTGFQVADLLFYEVRAALRAALLLVKYSDALVTAGVLSADTAQRPYRPAMTVLDIAAIAVVALSLVLAWARGVIRSLVGTLAWIVGFVAAIAFAPAVAVFLPDTPNAPRRCHPPSSTAPRRRSSVSPRRRRRRTRSRPRRCRNS